MNAYRKSILIKLKTLKNGYRDRSARSNVDSSSDSFHRQKESEGK